MKNADSSRQSKLTLPDDVLEAFEADIVPHIKASCELAMAAYDLDQVYNDNYVMGTYVWGNLFNRLRSLNKKRWKVSASENDLRVSLKGMSEPLEFRVHRCDETTRIPTGGKRAKRSACNREYLSLEIKDKATQRYQLIVTYDVNPFQGLGSITIEQLIATTPKDILALTVATLYQNERIGVSSDASSPEPESIGTPAVEKSPTPEKIGEPKATRTKEPANSRKKLKK